MASYETERSPVLGNVETPLEGEMGILVVVDEAGEGVVVAAGKNAVWGLLLLNYRWGMSVSGTACTGVRIGPYTSSCREAACRCWARSYPVVSVSKTSTLVNEDGRTVELTIISLSLLTLMPLRLTTWT